jgi:hypothetical protein
MPGTQAPKVETSAPASMPCYKASPARSLIQIIKNAPNALLFSNRRAFLLVLLKWPVREIKAMFPAIEELNRLKAVERAAYARLDRLNRTCPAIDEVIKVAEEYWKEAAESLRDFQEE